jgi:hypothetical protein
VESLVDISGFGTEPTPSESSSRIGNDIVHSLLHGMTGKHLHAFTTEGPTALGNGRPFATGVERENGSGDDFLRCFCALFVVAACV